MAQFLRLHESPAAFREALSFTEAESGFTRRLIEKDYYCSLILADFEPLFADGLVFKGGTSLSKVHANFYRLSEDLDFAISIPASARRSDRRRAAAPVKSHLDKIAKRLPAVEIASPLNGHNECRQYEAILQYVSAVTGEHETVRVEVAVREPIIEPTVSCIGRTLIRHPVPNEIPEVRLSLCVLSLYETYAEKVRAALTRDPPAIRDIFDITEAVHARRLVFYEPRFLDLVRQKLAVPGNASVDTSPTRRTTIVSQVETHLKPVLRAADYTAFDINRAFAEIEQIAAAVRGD
jgi:predicted nucleotidyltransferase component of viral defense system